MDTRTSPVVPPVLERRHVEALEGLVTPLLSDNLDRLAGVVGLTRYNRKRKLIGTALTVKTRPGDNLYVYQALSLLRPGHVLVIDAGGALENAIVGELIKLYAEQHGCTGFVVDGAIRDVACFETGDFPCYARGIQHRGPYKSGPGRLNVPVAIGGQVVCPGDVLVGDEDGLVVFPHSDIDRLIEDATRKLDQENAIRDEILTGRHEQVWLTAVLHNGGLAP
ncbi:RraA family protein [Rhodoplanes roseus]|uniref:Putative 4-hydroxy-4-methyl-2-oxoglutarate aldolase n=1 Tax=Rhodoplanes roseus TaxID=29409 RepID=A0A327KYJ3_9BRAD|nr:RraA family protein [Rhodoplanes roseus]RAI43341.1 methyltransferase [Rhodoplanes roseus]